MQQTQDFAHDPSRWRAGKHIVFGTVVIVALFGGGGYWSVNTEISGAVVATGELRVETNQKPVQHPEGGVVGAIFVREGQSVKANQPLLRLEQITQDAQRAILESQITELQAQETRLVAERDSVTRLNFPPDLLAKASPGSDIGKIVEDQRSLLNARLAGYRQQAAQLRERVGQIQNEIEGSGSRLSSFTEQLTSVRGEESRIQGLLNQGLTTETRLQEILREKARIEGEIGALQSNNAGLKRQIQETRIEMTRLREGRREDALSELREVQGRINEIRQRIVVADESLRKIEIRSPQDGVVQDLAVFAPGAVVAPGEPIMTIVPVADRLVLEVKVQPINRDQINIDRPARVRFSTFNQRTTPELNGTVVKISPDRKIDEMTGAPFFAVEVLIPEEERERLGSENVLVPGLPAEIYIETDKRTPMSYLLKPLTDNFQKAFREK